MAVTFNGAAVSATPADLIMSALQEIAAFMPGEGLSAQDAAWGLEKLQRQIDQWNARRELIFNRSLTLYNLQANHAPHTIGPGGDFNTPIRPVSVLSASFVLDSGSENPVDSPIKVKDADWWAVNPTKSLTSTIVTHLFYDPAPGLGNLNFWPISTVANPVRLETWNSLTQALTLSQSLGFVQGYWEAVILDLAVRLAPSYERPVSAELRDNWNRAMRIIEANNEAPPRVETDLGMPSSRKGGRPDFNFLTGLRD